ncbi:MAG: CpsD/CapB family tyrosine-protein kinase [Firmicutes bacterium]|nr:CpsD/CapB family tyrosine-protein kinase [Bacillota bacterium]
MRKRRLIIHDDPKAVESEAFRILRTNLEFTSPDREIKTLLITSAGAGDGKSIVSSNLAVAWANSGRRVLLVGADLRKPTLHRIFSVSNAPGLTSYLTGQASLEDVILDSGRRGLDLIPGGPIPPNPAELLQSKVMSDLILKLRALYDYVIFDGTPVIAVADAMLLAHRVDGTVLVLSAYKVPKEMALYAKEQLEKAQARLLGVVLNGVRLQDQRGYHHYFYYDESRTEHAQ